MQTDMQDLPAVFSDIFTLAHEYQIFVPSTMQVNNACDNSEYVNKIAESLAKLEGGATITTGVGAWNSESLGLVKEDVTIISSSALNFNNAGEVLNLCRWLKTEMSQEAIALKIDGKLFLI